MSALTNREASRTISNFPQFNYSSQIELSERLGEGKSTPILIFETDDIVIARAAGRRLGKRLGCSNSKIALVTTAISELARNIILYSNHGEISISESFLGKAKAIMIIAQDAGPGISDINLALAGGYSTSGGLGLGLSGLKRISDSLDVTSGPTGTCVKVLFGVDSI